jgi:cullin 1
MLYLFKQVVKEEFNCLLRKNEILVVTENPKDIVYKTNYIEEFINFYSVYSKIITEAFNNNNSFNIAFKEVLENIQSQNIKFNNSYLLPFYIDKFFKRSSTNNSQDAGLLITRIYSIFPTLPDKDIFIDSHRNLLSNRLLSDDYNSIDNEKNLIGKLKVLGGVVYTSNVEVMLNDFNNSKIINENYRKALNISTSDFFIQILTHECWPSLNVNTISLPTVIHSQMETFMTYYTSTFKNRTLQFSLQYSNAEVEYKLDQKNFFLTMNTIQAAICMNVFNEIKYRPISIEEILTQLKGQTEDINTALQALVNVKLVIHENELFRLNKDFTSNSKRLKIISLQKAEEIIKKEKIEDDRSHAVEAAIVRIMKGSQRLHHNNLVENILTQLENFKVKVQVK